VLHPRRRHSTYVALLYLLSTQETLFPAHELLNRRFRTCFPSSAICTLALNVRADRAAPPLQCGTYLFAVTGALKRGMCSISRVNLCKCKRDVKMTHACRPCVLGTSCGERTVDVICTEIGNRLHQCRGYGGTELYLHSALRLHAMVLY
jgi:hypothetical protein